MHQQLGIGGIAFGWIRVSVMSYSSKHRNGFFLSPNSSCLIGERIRSGSPSGLGARAENSFRSTVHPHAARRRFLEPRNGLKSLMTACVHKGWTSSIGRVYCIVSKMEGHQNLARPVTHQPKKVPGPIRQVVSLGANGSGKFRFRRLPKNILADLSVGRGIKFAFSGAQRPKLFHDVIGPVAACTDWKFQGFDVIVVWVNKVIQVRRFDDRQGPCFGLSGSWPSGTGKLERRNIGWETRWVSRPLGFCQLARGSYYRSDARVF